jgi:hypothetical protein
MQQPAAEGTTYGFLTTVDSGSHGVFGGYLLVDVLGRPLEFHCTAPVKVSRAQQILYGPTLAGHLHGRQIGGALLAEATCQPVVLLTDVEAMLQVRPHTPLPVALVRRCPDPASPPVAPADALTFAGVVVVPPAGTPALATHLEALAAAVDLSEPFERIRAAIEEAQRH